MISNKGGEKMKIIDIFRHGEDENTGDLTREGIQEIRQLGKRIKDSGISYSKFISSPYFRCVVTLKIVLEELGLGEDLIEMNENLCTREPEQWTRVTRLDKFRQVLGETGSKVIAVSTVDPGLIIKDANQFITGLQHIVRNMKEGTCTLGISHNTIILAAASIIQEGRLSIKTPLQDLNICEGVRFKVKRGNMSVEKICRT